ncbi:extracellular calcium-sensing receptor [Xenopus laevis]|uniref:Extracellular calcium-sensing receptor n=1 Tax=Xenopus laevis TaxID=8355 RepID=A0A8J1MIQ6_XENLA|nr:extracellular calcium-sensing receptor [Xenopus laevis]
MQVVKQEVIKAGACIAFFVDIMTSKPDRNAPKIARILRESTAKVIVVMASGADFLIVLEELLRQNVTGKVWVGSEAWASSTFLSVKRFQDVLVGSVGFSIHADQISGFAEYFESLNPSSDLHDPFIKEFWEQAFSCKWLDQDELVNNASLQPCTGKEKLGNVMLKLDFRLSLNVYTAVYAFAWALQNLHDCQLGKGQFEHESCTNISFFQPWQLLYYVKHVNFKTKDGNHIFFDAKGNPPPIYDIINWRLGCSESCPVGFAKLTLPGKPICCFQCVRCPQGQISNQTDAVMCQQCSWDTWSSFQQDKCIPKAIDFLSYVELLGLSLAAISISSSVVPLCIVSIFMCHKTTPVVRANNYSLSCLLLLSLFLCFLCSLGFIGYPQSEMCLLRQVAFGMVFSLCISSVLAKTITVVIAFTAIQPGSRLKRWTSVKVSYCVVVFCMCIQLSVCMVWFSFSPPFPEHDIITQPGVIIINCNEGSPTAFWCMLGFLGILASISFIVAFLARRLPDSFNEAKFITFSMLAFLTVWISFIPAYFSARGKYTVAMEIFAILSSTWAMVACIFMPKCYIILLRPDMNSREHLMKSGRGQ